jgi:hypothetical protein
MVTTAIVVELLVVGMQALAWVLPAMMLFSPHLATVLIQIPGTGTPVFAAMFLAAVYTLGVLSDTAARGAVLFLRPGKLILRVKWVAERVKDTAPDARIRIAAKESRLDALLSYYLVRMRVLRGVAFNSSVAAVLWLLVAALDRVPSVFGGSPSIAVVIGLSALVVGTISAVAFALNEVDYGRRVQQIDKLLGLSEVTTPQKNLMNTVRLQTAPAEAFDTK